MEIFINGNRQQVTDHCSIAALIEHLELYNKRIAIEVNESIIPRSQHKTHILSNGDRLEIVEAIGGG